MKLYYSEYILPESLQGIFSGAAKFVVKEKKKLNFQLLPDYTSSLLIIFNGKTKSISLKIAGYRDKKIKLNLSENSYIHLLKFKPEIFYLLNKGDIEKFKNRLTSFSKIKIEEEIISDEETIEILSKYFEIQNINIASIKDYVIKSVNEVVSSEGIYKIEKISANAGTSMRQFQREFKKVTGFSPKEFSSIVRINSLTSELIKENVSFRDIFFNFGFYDQAHFNKEFKKIIGSNPALFESRQKLIRYLKLLK